MGREIVAKGITKIKELAEMIRKKLFPADKYELMDEDETTCEDIFAPQICADLKETAAKLKLKVQVIDELVRHTLSKGITDAKAAIAHIRKDLIEKAKNFKCEDALPENVCAKMKEIVTKIKGKAAEVDELVKELVAKGMKKITEIIKKIREKLIPA